MKEIIRVAMADLGIARAPAILMTIGLGSCVGVTLYDPVIKLGGLAHIVLPYQRMGSADGKPGKYADRAIAFLLEELISRGAVKQRLEAKLAGGAQMFANKGSETSEILKVGQRNVEAARKILGEIGIKIVAADTGGNYGRTIELETETGALRIKTIAHGEKYI
ncbi:MAG: chemotaxis protein CheD [bacterium]